jgi:hypothetical protein
MTLRHFLFCGLVAAGSLLTAQTSRVFELRVYHCLPGRLPALQARFRDHTIAIFNKHHMTSIAYWTPQDPATKDNTLIYILAHESREAARKNWSEFGADPEWREVVKVSEADGGKIVEKVDSSFMDPTDYSPIK